MRKTLIAVAAMSAALAFASVSYAKTITITHTTTNTDSGNGKQSVSGLLNEQAVTGNGATGIYNNASPIISVCNGGHAC
jgi:hypothetical protein